VRRGGESVDRPVRVDSLKELSKYEDHVLDAIARTPHGALLFLSDPARFLKEAGFVVGKDLLTELSDLPGLKESSPGGYEDVRSGKGRAATWRVQIRSLGLRSGRLDELKRDVRR
jgi:hypothetical protein